MASLLEIVQCVSDHITTVNGLDITCIKGYPDFRRPDIAPPVAALFYGGSQRVAENVRKRVGASATGLVLTLGIYASNEVELLALAQKLQEMRTAAPRLTVDDTTIKLYIGDDDRPPPAEDDPKELRHFIECSLVVVYE